MFKDEVFEELDDISRLVEPYTFSVIDELAEFPERIEVTFDDIKTGYYGISDLSVQDVLCKHAKAGTAIHARANQNYIKKCFSFEIDGDPENLTVDFVNKKFSNKIYMVKVQSTLDEELLEKMAIKEITSESSTMRWSDMTDSSRLNEIASIFGAKGCLKARSKKKKITELFTHLQSLVESNKLNVRDIDLCAKISTWIRDYTFHGNLAAISNLTQVKVMMHSGNPIYSVQEIK